MVDYTPDPNSLCLLIESLVYKDKDARTRRGVSILYSNFRELNNIYKQAIH